MEEHLLACSHHAPVNGQPGKLGLVAAKVEDDNEHPKGARDMHRLTGNHRSSFKNGLKTKNGIVPRSTQNVD
jgi:hypothetical protein